MEEIYTIIIMKDNERKAIEVHEKEKAIGILNVIRHTLFGNKNISNAVIDGTRIFVDIVEGSIYPDVVLN